MVKKTIVAVLAIVLLSIVFVGAAQRWGYTRYGAVYSYGTPYYSYYPLYQYPFYGGYYSYYRSPYYTYPYYYSPLASDYVYRYGAPSTAYPSPTAGYGAPSTAYPSPVSGELPRGGEGQLCGMIDSQQYGCEYGLVCDYKQGGVGVCARQSGGVTYTSPPTAAYPYYYYG